MDKYIGEFYETKEEALVAFNEWKAKAYADIEAKGDKVLRDTSHVYQKLVWKQKEVKPGELNYAYESDEYKWFISRMIWTQHMVDDIKNFPVVDHEAELEKAIKEATSEIPKEMIEQMFKQNINGKNSESNGLDKE